jgi:hypothetical protein
MTMQYVFVPGVGVGVAVAAAVGVGVGVGVDVGVGVGVAPDETINVRRVTSVSSFGSSDESIITEMILGI